MTPRILHIRKLTDQGKEPDLQNTTPAQRLGMMWQLALDAWAFKGKNVAKSRFQRHVVRQAYFPHSSVECEEIALG